MKISKPSIHKLLRNPFAYNDNGLKSVVNTEGVN